MYELDENLTEEEKLKRLHRRFKHIRDTSDPFNIPISIFKQHYGLHPELVFKLFEMIKDEIESTGTNKVHAIMKLLITLNYLKTGARESEVGQNFLHPASETSVARFTAEVIEALVQLAPYFIRFPSTAEERQLISAEFQKKGVKFPGVLGVIDDSTIRLSKPKEKEEHFVTTNGHYGMNVSFMVDAESRILFLKVCPGSYCNKTAWDKSPLKAHMAYLRTCEEVVETEGKYYVLGDSSCGKSPLLLSNPDNARSTNPSVKRYNENVSSIKSSAKRAIGEMKNVFKVIHKDKIIYDRKKAYKIATACALLHNFEKDPVPKEPTGTLDVQDSDSFTAEDGKHEEAIIVKKYFTK